MIGKISKISGPTVVASGMDHAGMYHRVLVGDLGLLGEVIRIEGSRATLQVYEDTYGLSLGEAVQDVGEPLMVELGPGLLSSIFDGIQRPLRGLMKKEGSFIERGLSLPALPREIRWEFEAKVRKGQAVGPGDVIGTVRETERITHRILVPPGVSGTIQEIRSGQYKIEETVGALERGRALKLLQRWPVRIPRPYQERRISNIPLITGQRIFDMLFPIALGGTSILPGGFGTGKTVTEHSLAKFARADIIIYIGCGERANEMAEVISDFPKLLDPHGGRPLMERTILIANTSNMPVGAREASIFTGITMAEYFRDMGYHVAVMADSTSRWAEALREISSRLEEMPGEEGFPSYLTTRLSQFFERSGQVRCLGAEDRTGSITTVSAVSPPGGDFSEPVTQSLMRISGSLWALDSQLAYGRHFPAVNWKKSYSHYTSTLDPWFREAVARDWPDLRGWLFRLLQVEEELVEEIQLVGVDVLPDEQRVVLEVSRLVREEFLRQSGYSSVDANCPLLKQYWMLKILVKFKEFLNGWVKKGRSVDQVFDCPIYPEITRMKEIPPENFDVYARSLIERMREELNREGHEKSGKETEK